MPSRESVGGGTRERSPTPRLLAMTGGLWIWGAQFTFIYGFTALACARGFADWSVAGVNVVRLSIVLATLVSLALTAALLVQAVAAHRRVGPQGMSSEGFITYSTLLVAGLSLIAIAWNGLPALIVPVCSS